MGTCTWPAGARHADKCVITPATGKTTRKPLVKPTVFPAAFRLTTLHYIATIRQWELMQTSSKLQQRAAAQRNARWQGACVRAQGHALRPGQGPGGAPVIATRATNTATCTHWHGGMGHVVVAACEELPHLLARVRRSIPSHRSPASLSAL
jgi:hypothetical protein